MIIEKMIKNKTVILFFLLLLAAGAYFIICRSNSIVLNSAEMKYVEGAKGLAETGHFEKWDFIANQAVKPFIGDKIFLTQVALAYKIFGVSELTTRLPSFFWGLVFFIMVFLLSLRLIKDNVLSLIMLFFVVFSHNFILMYRVATPEGMYLAFFMIGLYLILLKKWPIKLCGILLLLYFFFSFFNYFEINIVSFSEVFNRMQILLKFIFADFRILWLMYVPIIIYLIQEKWWQKKQEAAMAIIALVLLAALPFFYEINTNNILVLFLSLVIWALSLISLKHFFSEYKKNNLIIFVIVISMMFSFPFLKPLPPITKAAVCDQMLEKNNKKNQQDLYQYFENNKLDIVHFIYANKYYLKDHTFNYAIHKSRKNLKLKFVSKYIQNSETGYLVYQNYLQKSVSGNLHKALMDNLKYHAEISQKTRYQVFSWDASQRANFLNEINSQNE